MVRRYFRLRRLLLGLAFAAIAVPIAQAQPGGAGFSTERPVRVQLAPQSAYANQWRARLDSYAAASSQTASPKQDNAETAGTSRPDGFSWTAAGIGAVVTFGAAALLLAVIAVGRRYRSRPEQSGLAST